LLWTVAVIVPIATAVVAGVVGDHSTTETAAIAGLDSIAWPRESTLRSPTPPAPTSVAPVGDLITGLEQRLANQPDDAKGWALLAQSYAFVANTHGAEVALARAVELGFDESDLRNRIGLASQSSQTNMSSQ